MKINKTKKRKDSFTALAKAWNDEQKAVETAEQLVVYTLLLEAMDLIELLSYWTVDDRPFPEVDISLKKARKVIGEVAKRETTDKFKKINLKKGV